MVVHLSSQCRELISYQRGVIARWQLTGCPADEAAVRALLRSGRWRTLYRGVYAAHVGGLSRESTLWAAVRRCGPAAALSHLTAAELDGLTDRRGDAVHVTIPAARRVWLSDSEFREELPRIVVHRSARFAQARHPARTPPRIRLEETVLDLVDLAENLDAAFGWLSSACNRGLITPNLLRAAVASRTKLRWRADLIVAIEEISGGVLSSLERGYLRNVERPHRLPEPRRQVRTRNGSRAAYLDNLFDDYGLAVELDGLAWHPAEARWQDIHRDNYLSSTGIITLRYNWADITGRPCQVAGQIALVLRQRGWTGAIRPCGPTCQAGSS